jgi:hypothetical protein
VTFAEALFLLFLIAVAAAGAYYYVQKRERIRITPVSLHRRSARVVGEGSDSRHA